MEIDNLVAALNEVGLSTYEARAYLGLLRNHPETGYELAKNTGIPQAKIYEVLARLIEKGMISQTHVEPTYYAPMDPEEFIGQKKDKYSRLLDELSMGLAELKKQGGPREYVWNLHKYEDIIDRAASFCAEAQQKIYLLSWQPELDRLAPALELAHQRGVEIVLVGFDVNSFAYGKLIKHRALGHIRSERGQQLMVVADTKSALMAALGEGELHAFWTQSLGIIRLVRDYILHEAYLWNILDRFAEIRDFFGEDLAGLRNL
ncbi:Sugar-specific transcriptional regulator TrmB [Neomoorella glycerini]|uniref:Sugar-specific transcriptional regulator TrmB n=1 Tax=Neomoorella glycerini TaxID=55779 RepID=A0A6I5ZTA1_9FIRM|nr:TrmB family transcriptional regulator [Moorella glycerini]QGP93140.1 Sugar-specific transcriptional regulator TrmB [Moorella glycerini]